MVERTLVCVIAETREHDVVWNNFKKNVLDELNADLALCISVPSNYDYSNQYWQHAKYKWTCPEYENWIDAFEYAKKVEFADAPESWKALLTIPNNWMAPVNGENGAGAILIFFRWLLLHNFKKDDIFKKYDRIIITRSDYMFLCPHPPMCLLDPNYVWVPDGAYHLGITDRYAVLSVKNAEAYLSIVKNMMVNTRDFYHKMIESSFPPGYHPRGCNLEITQKVTLEMELGEKCCRVFPFIMYSVRSENGKTRWATGNWDQDLGYYIKYNDEYENAKKFEQIYKTTDDWFKYSF